MSDFYQREEIELYCLAGKAKFSIYQIILISVYFILISVQMAQQSNKTNCREISISQKCWFAVKDHH